MQLSLFGAGEGRVRLQWKVVNNLAESRNNMPCELTLGQMRVLCLRWVFLSSQKVPGWGTAEVLGHIILPRTRQ